MEVGSLKRSRSSIEAGRWVADIPGMEDVRLRVRGLTSPTVMTLRSRKERKVSRADRERDGQLKPDAALRVLAEVMHEAVLLDWDGITDNGEPVLYDAELAKEWLTDPDMMPFADAVAWAAQVVDKGDEAEETAKN